MGVVLLRFGPSSAGAYARIGLPAALHEVGSPATVASLPAGSPTQAEGITICAFSIAIVIEASAGRSGGDLASAEPDAMSIAGGAFRLGPESGRLLIRTARTGLGAKAGHDLTIEVTRWHGHARVDTAVPANSSVTIQVDVDSFQVRQGTGGVKPLTDADRAAISKTLKQVLHTAQHPTITFRSRRVDGSAGSFTLDGELTIMGITRPVTVRGGVTDGRVVGGASVVQSRWGIRPYSAFFGALRLSDEVKVDFDVALTPDG